MELPMPSVGIDAAQLERLTRNLEDYVKVYNRLTLPEVLDKKGNDARIQLFRLFWEERFGSKRAKNGRAWIELRRRTRAGQGTLVRQRYLSSNWGKAPEFSRKGRKLNYWQKLVWQEATRRQAGAGLLGVSFLSRRFRTTNSRGKFLVQNASKKLGTLVQIQKGETYYQITGYTPGLATIEARNSILNKTVNYLNEDIEAYLARKFNEAQRIAFK